MLSLHSWTPLCSLLRFLSFCPNQNHLTNCAKMPYTHCELQCIVSLKRLIGIGKIRGKGYCQCQWWSSPFSFTKYAARALSFIFVFILTSSPSPSGLTASSNCSGRRGSAWLITRIWKGNKTKEHFKSEGDKIPPFPLHVQTMEGTLRPIRT